MRCRRSGVLPWRMDSRCSQSGYSSGDRKSRGGMASEEGPFSTAAGGQATLRKSDDNKHQLRFFQSLRMAAARPAVRIAEHEQNSVCVLTFERKCLPNTIRPPFSSAVLMALLRLYPPAVRYGLGPHKARKMSFDSGSCGCPAWLSPSPEMRGSTRCT